MSILLKQEIKYYIINTDVTNNLSLKKRIPCIQYDDRFTEKKGVSEKAIQPNQIFVKIAFFLK